MADKSRAEYFKKRRENTRTFYVEIEKGKMDMLEEKLSQKKMTKKEWLNEKIDTEIKK